MFAEYKIKVSRQEGNFLFDNFIKYKCTNKIDCMPNMLITLFFCEVESNKLSVIMHNTA